MGLHFNFDKYTALRPFLEVIIGWCWLNALLSNAAAAIKICFHCGISWGVCSLHTQQHILSVQVSIETPTIAILYQSTAMGKVKLEIVEYLQGIADDRACAVCYYCYIKKFLNKADRAALWRVNSGERNCDFPERDMKKDEECVKDNKSGPCHAQWPVCSLLISFESLIHLKFDFAKFGGLKFQVVALCIHTLAIVGVCGGHPELSWRRRVSWKNGYFFIATTSRCLNHCDGTATEWLKVLNLLIAIDCASVCWFAL